MVNPRLTLKIGWLIYSIALFKGDVNAMKNL